MATTIKSTDLDFNEIRNSLKLFLAQQDQFADYNFEGSALSNLLDVLAYNTHYNGLLANFALNEAFLSTAQLRSSIVGLAGSLGYSTQSRKASFAVVNMYVNNPAAPTSMTLPAGRTFSAKIDNVTYTFKTRDALIAVNNGSNQYFFALNDNLNVPIYEGVPKTKTFVASPAADKDSYIIPTTNLDLDTVVVRVYDSPVVTNYDLYTNINEATTINASSRIYVVKEAPNGFYELTFGNGGIGTIPAAGNKIEVLYDVVSGPDANGARKFTADQTVEGLELTVVTVANSTGGTYKEDIESIRKNAPYQYAAQNRMVTAEDYATLSRRNFSNVINDIKAWGGEDNVPPKYGTVFLSIDFGEITDTSVQTKTKNGIIELARDLSVVSFDVEFTDPIYTYLEVTARFQFNPNLTSLEKSTVETNVKNTIENYFDANLGGFDKSFRRSNMLTDIDETDDAILSSRADIRMQNRFVPTPGAKDYVVYYPSAIDLPSEDEYIIRSENFYLNGKICFLRNRLDSNIIEIVNIQEGVVAVDNAGYYDATNGTLHLNSFAGTLLSGSHIKITAVPANQSVINPVRNNIIVFDKESSKSIAVVTDTL